MGSLEIDSIRNYLIEVGCKVEYPILVNAFKKYLYNPDPSIQGKVRTQFKDYVNRLATVNVENNMKFITLRSEFRPANNQLQTQQQQQQQQPSSPKQPSPITKQNHSPPSIMQPMTMSSPRRQDESLQRFPRSNDTTMPPPPLIPDQNQPNTRSSHRPQMEPLILSPIQHPSQHHQRIDRLESPRVHSQQQQQQQQPPLNQHYQRLAPQQQQQQPFPTPPPIPQHNRPQQQSVSRTQHVPSSPVRTTMTPKQDSQQQFFSPHQNNQHHFRSQSQPMPRQHPSTPQVPNHHTHQGQQRLSQTMLAQLDNNLLINNHRSDSMIMMPPPPPPPPPHLPPTPILQQRQHLSVSHQSSLHRQSSSVQSLNAHQEHTADNGSTRASQMMPPPRPPPRRRQSTASLFKPSPIKQNIIDKSSSGREMHELARKSVAGRVKEHAHRFNSSASSTDLSALMPKRNSSMKENRLSRDMAHFGSISSALQRNGSYLTNRSRSSHRTEDESDSSSLQPIDPLRRRWAIEACSCNYNNLLVLLREDPKLAPCKDIINGYTALHWAAKFGNLDIIKLIAGSYSVSANIKSSAGHTPLHVAYMFNRMEAASLLLQSYQASPDIRDHSGKKPLQYWQKPKTPS